MRSMLALVATAVLTLALAVAAMAATGADGAGQDFAQHHAIHAQEMGGLAGQ